MYELKMNKVTKKFSNRSVGVCFTPEEFEIFQKATKNADVKMSPLLRELAKAFCRGEIKIKF